MKQKDARLDALQRRFDALTAELSSRAEGAETDAARDADLRNAIVAAGDDALQLLQADRATGQKAAPDFVKDQP